MCHTVLGNTFRPKGDEVTGGWSRVRSDELQDLSSSPNNIWVIKSRRMRGGHVASMGERRVAYRALVGNPEGKRQQLGWPWRRWEGNIKWGIS
jgi:hypothetical protein